MSRIVVCLDCPHYQTGGYCRLKHKEVGALNPACDQTDKEGKQTPRIDRQEKTCSKCGRTLPIDSFSKNKTAPDGRQSTCKECSKAAYEAWDLKRKISKKKTMEATEKTIKTKRCNRCGRELPITEFYAKTGTKDGLQYECKHCHTEIVKACREKRKAQAAPPDQEVKTVVVREKMTARQMVDALRADGWEVTCIRTTTEEL